MTMHVTILVVFSAISFFGYGLSCLTTQYMQTEFTRYGMSRYRSLTGVLQLAGAAGLLVGLKLLLLGSVAAAGLALLMFLGFCVRLKIKDGFIKSSPAFLYFVLNTYIAYALYASHIRES